MSLKKDVTFSDDELLDKYQSTNNTEWLGILLLRYSSLLLGTCMKYLKKEDEAKNAVQQIFLKVLSDINKYKIENFKNWIYVVAKHYCLMQLRKKAIINYIDSNNFNNLSENSNLIEYEENDFILEEIAYALQSLNNVQKNCIVLFYLKKMSYSEISNKTGYPLKLIKSYIQNGKRNLKLIIEKRLANNER